MPLATTELENCTLATILRDQPCSAYAVRQVFARSTTPDWSGSTGAIYPVIERLLRQGLIQAEPQVGDRRGRRNLSVTADGERAVYAWVTTFEPGIAQATPDPIRTRVSYLGQLASDAQRIDFLTRAGEATEAELTVLRPLVTALLAVAMPEYLAGLGAIRQLEGRITWLREVISFYETTEETQNGAT